MEISRTWRSKPVAKVAGVEASGGGAPPRYIERRSRRRRRGRGPRTLNCRGD